jgi:hypothetical protein
MALAESAEFIFAGFNPEGAFTAFAEFNVVGKLTSVRVEGIAMEGKVVEGGGGGSAGGRGNGRSGGSKVDMLCWNEYDVDGRGLGRHGYAVAVSGCVGCGGSVGGR